jgi:hypothetical protein
MNATQIRTELLAPYMQLRGLIEKARTAIGRVPMGQPEDDDGPAACLNRLERQSESSGGERNAGEAPFSVARQERLEPPPAKPPEGRARRPVCRPARRTGLRKARQAPTLRAAGPLRARTASYASGRQRARVSPARPRGHPPPRAVQRPRCMGASRDVSWARFSEGPREKPATACGPRYRFPRRRPIPRSSRVSRRRLAPRFPSRPGPIPVSPTWREHWRYRSPRAEAPLDDEEAEAAEAACGDDSERWVRDAFHHL